MDIQKILKAASMWLMRFSFYTVVILIVGTIIGSVGFVTIGSLFTKGYTCEFLLKKGASIGFRYAGVWAGGTAIVLCIMKGKKDSESKQVLS